MAAIIRHYSEDETALPWLVGQRAAHTYLDKALALDIKGSRILTTKTTTACQAALLVQDSHVFGVYQTSCTSQERQHVEWKHCMEAKAHCDGMPRVHAYENQLSSIISVTFDRGAETKIYKCAVHDMYIMFTCSVVNTSYMLMRSCIASTVYDFDDGENRTTTTTHSENNSDVSRMVWQPGPLWSK